MTPLFTTLYGSTLYGTNTPESDRDIKRIVLPDIRDALLGKVPKNKVKITNKQEGIKNTSEDTDVEEIPLQVFARDFMQGQTYALELAYAVMYTNAEQEIHFPLFAKFCEELRENYATSDMYAMVGYATKQASLYSDKGERLNALERLYQDLEVCSKQHLMDTKLSEVWDEVVSVVEPIAKMYPRYVQITEYDINPQGDKRPCIKVLEKILPYSASFFFNLKTILSSIDSYGARAKAAQQDQVDWKATAHALRIIDEGIVLLGGHPLVYPYPADYIKKLKAIKSGKIDHKLVMGDISAQMDLLKTTQLSSKLPPISNELKAKQEEWLYGWLLEFYQLEDGLVLNHWYS